MKGEKEAKVKQESVEVRAPEGWQLNLLALIFTMVGACVMSELDTCLMSARLFSLQQFLLFGNQRLCWPNLTLQSLNWASTLSSSKYFPAHTFLGGSWSTWGWFSVVMGVWEVNGRHGINTMEELFF